MGSFPLDRVSTLANFDLLRDGRALFWDEAPDASSFTDRGLSFEFLVSQSLGRKPQLKQEETQYTPRVAVPTNLELNEQSSKQISEVLKSDIDNHEPEYHLLDVCGTHSLILNKFCVFRPQYLLLTIDPAESQEAPLTYTDFKAALTALSSLRGPHFLIFNCGRDAGCSRVHKHMQIFEQDNHYLLPDQVRGSAGLTQLPYRHYFHDLPPDFVACTNDVAAHLSHLYDNDMQRCKADLKLPDANGLQPAHIAHNLVITDRWMMTIPRRRAGLGVVTANAAGFLGVVWIPYREHVAMWKQLGPTHVLESLGLPF